MCANGTDVLGLGLDGAHASPDDPFEAVLDSQADASGAVPDGDFCSGANLRLVPIEGSANRWASSRFASSLPGKYILLA